MPARVLALLLSAVLTALAIVGAHAIGTWRRGFVATEATFADYADWTRFDRGSQPVGPQHPDGASAVFINALPPPSATRFPDGTAIVRVTTGSDPDPASWEVHAMVRRGGAFNPDGARGWEFFDLVLERDARGAYVPRIAWRGLGPTQGDGYTGPDGSVELDCNHCHGAAVANDSILGPELALQAP